ncbi:MAG: hypothetical protein WA510_10645 [Acidobacteriaceae bacterium]
MPGRNRNLREHRLLWMMLGFLCCALITLGGIAQVVHTHTDGHAVHSDCALCHTANQVVEPAVSYALPCNTMVVAPVPTAPRPVRTQVYFVFSLFTRPPPAKTANA